MYVVYELLKSLDLFNESVKGVIILTRRMSDNRVRTQVGTQMLKTQPRVKNPKQSTYESIADVTPGGYKRMFLAAWANLNARNSLIDLRTTPILTFDPEKWIWEEQNGRLVVQKQEPGSKYGEMVLETDS